MTNQIPRLAKLALAIGLLYGFIEAAEVIALSLAPGALSWQTGNSPYVAWVAPLTYAVAFGAIGVAFASLARLEPRIPWEALLVFLLLLLGGFLAASLQGRLASDLTSAILALGIATEGTRQYRLRRERLSRLLFRATPMLAALTAVAAVVTVGGAMALEARAMRALPAAQSNTPNVLLLVMDTQRADHLSLHGYSRRTSPRLDSLAAESAVFTNASANSSWTLPTHATLFTGRMPFEHRAGMIGRSFLDGRFPTIAEALTERGYATGGFIANVFWTGRHTGLHRGFTHYEDYYGNLGDAIARTAIGRRLTYGVLPLLGWIDVPGRKRAEELNHDLLAWLDEAGERPFFAFVNYFDVHTPLLPPAPFAGTYSGLSLSERRAHTIAIDDLDEANRPPSADTLSVMVDLYDESIRYLDFQIGTLMDSLERRGVLDNTLVIVTSDHGESWGEHGQIYHANSLYRDVTHVPLIVRLPGRVRPSSSEYPVGVDQIPATIARYTGIAGGIFPGESIFADSTDLESTPPGVILQLARRAGKRNTRPSSRTSLSGIVSGRWYYIEPHTERPELYDIASDPRQERDLARDTSYKDTVASMHGLLLLKEKGRRAAFNQSANVDVRRTHR